MRRVQLGYNAYPFDSLVAYRRSLLAIHLLI